MNLYDSWLCTRPIAHRGYHNDRIPENSLAAFEHAAKNGYAAELDIQCLGDGTVVVFHDDNLLRMTGRDCRPKDLKKEDLEKLPLLQKSGEKSDQLIPTLQETLALAKNHRLPLLIEIKSHSENGEDESRMLEILKDYDGEYAIMSFFPDSVRFFKGKLDVPFGCLTDAPDEEAWNKINFSKEYFDFIDYHYSLLPNAWVDREKCPVIVWTVRSQEVCDMISSRCENITFENFVPVWKSTRKRFG